MYRNWFSHEDNQDIAKAIVPEVKAQLPSASSSTVKGSLCVNTIECTHSGMYPDAARTYFNSVSSLEKQKQSGRYKEKSENQKKKNRLMRVCFYCVIFNTVSCF